MKWIDIAMPSLSYPVVRVWEVARPGTKSQGKDYDSLTNCKVLKPPQPNTYHLIYLHHRSFNITLINFR